ncbi:MAG: hypothetical protein ABW061_26455 [Polyangiaceae bacterium]
MKPRQRWALGCSLLLLSACSSKTDPPSDKPGSSNLPDISNVVYVGAPTDDALLRLLAAPTKDEPQKYVLVDAPDFSVPLSQDSPATIAFHLASQARAPFPALKAPQRAPAWQRPLRDLLHLLGAPRPAYAHGTPYNGTAYLLVISDADDKTKLRVFTSNPSYTPQLEAWQSLAQAAQPLRLEITSAFFEENNIPADGGPFVGGSFEFRIE